MPTLFESRIDIDAPPALVWGVLTDLDRYSEWNTFCPKAESTLQPGSPIVMAVQMNAHHRRTQREIVRAIEPGVKVCWGVTIGAEWIMTGSRWQILEPRGERRCHYHTWERFTGVLAPFIGAAFGGDVQRGFDQCAVDLKRRAESLAG
jgi:hypothetical protein